MVFHLKNVMAPRFVFFLLMILSGIVLRAQDSINFSDSSGRRQGHWIISGKMLPQKGYAADQKIEEGNYINHRKEGIWTEYYQNGRKKSDLPFVNNRPKGLCIFYFESGNIRERCYWNGSRPIYFQEQYFDRPGKLEWSDSISPVGLRLQISNFLYDSLWNLRIKAEVFDSSYSQKWKLTYYEINGSVREIVCFSDSVPQVPTYIRYGSFRSLKKYRNPDYWMGQGSTGCSDKTIIIYNSSRQKKMKGVFENNKLKDGEEYVYDDAGKLIKTKIFSDFKFLREK